MNNCKECGGIGVVKVDGKYVKCEACSRTNLSSYKNEEVSDTITEAELINKLDSLRSPLYVYDSEFDYNADKVLRDRSISAQERRSVELNSFLTVLTELNERSKNGIQLPNSYFIVSDRGYSKSMFKWSIIKNYIKNGYKVSPVLSTEDIYNLKTINTPESIEEYKDYFNNDIIVLDLVGSIRNPRLNIVAMIEVLEKCGRLSKPLICFSNFGLNEVKERTPEYFKNVYKNNAMTGKYDVFVVNEYRRGQENENEDVSFRTNR